jgi:hypothetical protein
MYALLFFTLILNTVSSITFNIVDLLPQAIASLDSDNKHWLEIWGEFSSILFEFILTCYGIGFLIIFKQIAKMNLKLREEDPDNFYKELMLTDNHEIHKYVSEYQPLSNGIVLSNSNFKKSS